MLPSRKAVPDGSADATSDGSWPHNCCPARSSPGSESATDRSCQTPDQECRKGFPDLGPEISPEYFQLHPKERGEARPQLDLLTSPRRAGRSDARDGHAGSPRTGVPGRVRRPPTSAGSWTPRHRPTRRLRRRPDLVIDRVGRGPDQCWFRPKPIRFSRNCQMAIARRGRPHDGAMPDTANR